EVLIRLQKFEIFRRTAAATATRWTRRGRLLSKQSNGAERQQSEYKSTHGSQCIPNRYVCCGKNRPHTYRNRTSPGLLRDSFCFCTYVGDFFHNRHNCLGYTGTHASTCTRSAGAQRRCFVCSGAAPAGSTGWPWPRRSSEKSQTSEGG